MPRLRLSWNRSRLTERENHLRQSGESVLKIRVQQTNQGGRLGDAGHLRSGVPRCADASEKGQTSGPVHSSFGWHLIELLDSRQVDAAQKDRAYRMLMNRKFSEEAATWMQEQRASAYVKILSN
jgi:hypothetical protein